MKGACLALVLQLKTSKSKFAMLLCATTLSRETMRNAPFNTLLFTPNKARMHGAIKLRSSHILSLRLTFHSQFAKIFKYLGVG